MRDSRERGGSRTVQLLSTVGTYHSGCQQFRAVQRSHLLASVMWCAVKL